MPKLSLTEVNNLGYDSVAEYEFHQRHPELKLITDKPYRYNFYDDQGEPFRAFPDFYDPSTQTCIEFKCHQLNTQPDKKTAKEKLEKVVQYKGRELLIDKIKMAWNHSMFKQAKVQSGLAALGFTMLVVFADGTKISTQNKNTMAKAGLEWCWEYEINGRLIG